jgi:hypothetical protein
LLQALVVVEMVSLDKSACVIGSRLSREIMHWCIGMAGPRSNRPFETSVLWPRASMELEELESSLLKTGTRSAG